MHLHVIVTTVSPSQRCPDPAERPKVIGQEECFLSHHHLTPLSFLHYDHNFFSVSGERATFPSLSLSIRVILILQSGAPPTRENRVPPCTHSSLFFQVPTSSVTEARFFWGENLHFADLVPVSLLSQKFSP